MKLSELLGVATCMPFEYQDEPTERGSRIGGHPPRGGVPHFDTPQQKYFGTLKSENDWDVSIFYSFDVFGDDEQRDIISHNNQVLYPSELIHAVIHRSDLADDQSRVPAEVSCHRINFGAVKNDVVEGEPSFPDPHSKVGGLPFIDNFSLVGRAFEKISAEGYQQLFQFDTPNPNQFPFVDGFPWDPGWLHVFVRGRDVMEWEFAFIIQQ